MAIKLGELADLPPTLDARQAAAIWGISRDHLYDLVNADACPVAPLRLGAKRLRWVTVHVLRSVGIDS